MTTTLAMRRAKVLKTAAEGAAGAPEAEGAAGAPGGRAARLRARREDSDE